MNMKMRPQSQINFWSKCIKRFNNLSSSQSQQYTKTSGFTLIELLLVLTVSGLVLGSSITMLTSYLKQSHINETRGNLAVIDNSLQQFLRLNGRYPCVADPNLAENAPNFGLETSNNCAGAGAVGGAVSVGGTGDNVLIGSVPTRTLGLTDDFMFDAWGNKIKYAVTANQATIVGGNPQYERELGAITIVDSAGNSIINPPNAGHYILLSHGRSERGAVSHNGVNRGDCLAIGATVDSRNCDDADATFVNTMIYSERRNASFFDDIVLQRGSSVFGRQIPAGTVMPFELIQCPPGWITLFAGTGINPAGRMIIGTNPIPSTTVYGYNDPYSDRIRTFRNNLTVTESFVLLQVEDDLTGTAEWKEHFDDMARTGTFVTIDTTSLTVTPATENWFVQITGAELPSVVPGANRDPYVVLTYCQKT